MPLGTFDLMNVLARNVLINGQNQRSADAEEAEEEKNKALEAERKKLMELAGARWEELPEPVQNAVNAFIMAEKQIDDYGAKTIKLSDAVRNGHASPEDKQAYADRREEKDIFWRLMASSAEFKDNKHMQAIAKMYAELKEARDAGDGKKKEDIRTNIMQTKQELYKELKADPIAMSKFIEALQSVAAHNQDDAYLRHSGVRQMIHAMQDIQGVIAGLGAKPVIPSQTRAGSGKGRNADDASRAVAGTLPAANDEFAGLGPAEQQALIKFMGDMGIADTPANRETLFMIPGKAPTTGHGRR